MTILALALVVASAIAHAVWNYLSKVARDSTAFMWCWVTLASIIYLPIAIYAAVTNPVPLQAWIYPAGTMALHVVYFACLGAAYDREDLSVVYPVARGTGIALVPLVAGLALGERVSPMGGLSIGVIVAGVVIAHTRGSGWSSLAGLAASFRRPGTQLAVLTGIAIALYSTWDKQGVVLMSPVVYVLFPFLGPSLAGIGLLPRRWPAIRRELAASRAAILAAAVLSPVAYLLVLFALTLSQVSYVAPTREIGIVFGAVLGARALKEGHQINRLLGSAAIVVGIFGLALAAA
jgi:drug/metabolite transporter (DMT)-like permease